MKNLIRTNTAKKNMMLNNSIYYEDLNSNVISIELINYVNNDAVELFEKRDKVKNFDFSKLTHFFSIALFLISKLCNLSSYSL